MIDMLALSARKLLRASLPDAIDMPGATAKVIGCGYGTDYINSAASIILSKVVKIALVHGGSFSAPASLQQGACKIYHHIRTPHGNGFGASRGEAAACNEFADLARAKSGTQSK